MIFPLSFKRIKGNLRWHPLLPAEQGGILRNPYCGFYTIYRFFADSTLSPSVGLPLEKIVPPSGQTLSLIEINLVRYRESPLPSIALDTVQRILAHFAAHGQIILRFLYDWDGRGLQNEPGEIQTILGHMEQLSPLMKKYAASLYILQGLWIGSWGEMHDTRYLSEHSMTRLARQLFESSDSGTFVALRCPSFVRMLFSSGLPLAPSDAFSGTPQSRCALYNDAILASDTDLGTYNNAADASAKPDEKRSRQEELTYQKRLCLFVPNGGEVVNDCNLNDFAPAVRTFLDMRLSYLNSEYDPQVLGKWKTSKTGLKDKRWKDQSAYHYIAAHLGYRFLVTKIQISAVRGSQREVRVRLGIQNTGFAPCYHKFETALFLYRTQDHPLIAFPLNTDTRFWEPGKEIILETRLDLSQIDERNPILGIRIYDPLSQVPIQLANEAEADSNHMLPLCSFQTDR